MSALRDSAAGLVAKVRTQLLVQSRGLEQSDIERRKAHNAIEKDCDALMAAAHELEPIVGPLEEYRGLLKERIDVINPEVIAVAKVLVQAIDAYVIAERPAPGHAGQWKVEGFVPAGDLRLPLGDREPEGKPPP